MSYLCTSKKTMKQVRLWMMAAILTLCSQSVFLSACKSTGTELPHVAGTQDEPLTTESAPAKVLEAMEAASRFHEHEIMSDTVNSISVCSIDEVDTTSTEGYGIVVVKGATSTTFPHIFNGRQPLARYDAKTGNLWLTSSAMQGTGIAVEWLYQIRFHDNDSAYIAQVIEPYNLQQQLCQRLGYSIDGERVTLYDDGRNIATTTNTVTDMGGFDSEQPLWIGEQMQYDLSGDVPQLLVTPGIKFTTGLVLTYDDMPTLSAPLTIANDGKVSIGDLKTVTHPYEGTYLDQDNQEPNLYVNYRRNDGHYDIQIGIYRLTNLDDGIGMVSDDGLTFTATDAAGNPIGGTISLRGDTAVVTFTNTTWELIEQGSQFLYVRQNDNQ